MRKSYGFRTYRVLELALYHSLGKLPEAARRIAGKMQPELNRSGSFQAFRVAIAGMMRAKVLGSTDSDVV